MVKIEELRLAPAVNVKIDTRAVHRSDNKDFIYKEYVGYMKPRNSKESITRIEVVVDIDRHTYDVIMWVYAKSYQKTMLEKRAIWAWENLWNGSICKTGIASSSVIAKLLEEADYDVEQVTLLK